MTKHTWESLQCYGERELIEEILKLQEIRQPKRMALRTLKHQLEIGNLTEAEYKYFVSEQ